MEIQFADVFSNGNDYVTYYNVFEAQKYERINSKMNTSNPILASVGTITGNHGPSVDVRMSLNANSKQSSIDYVVNVIEGTKKISDIHWKTQCVCLPSDKEGVFNATRVWTALAKQMNQTPVSFDNIMQNYHVPESVPEEEEVEEGKEKTKITEEIKDDNHIPRPLQIVENKSFLRRSLDTLLELLGGRSDTKKQAKKSHAIVPDKRDTQYSQEQHETDAKASVTAPPIKNKRASKKVKGPNGEEKSNTEKQHETGAAETKEASNPKNKRQRKLQGTTGEQNPPPAANKTKEASNPKRKRNNNSNNPQHGEQFKERKTEEQAQAQSKEKAALVKQQRKVKQKILQIEDDIRNIREISAKEIDNKAAQAEIDKAQRAFDSANQTMLNAKDKLEQVKYTRTGIDKATLELNDATLEHGKAEIALDVLKKANELRIAELKTQEYKKISDARKELVTYLSENTADDKDRQKAIQDSDNAIETVKAQDKTVKDLRQLQDEDEANNSVTMDELQDTHAATKAKFNVIEID